MALAPCGTQTGSEPTHWPVGPQTIVLEGPFAGAPTKPEAHTYEQTVPALVQLSEAMPG